MCILKSCQPALVVVVDGRGPPSLCGIGAGGGSAVPATQQHATRSCTTLYCTAKKQKKQKSLKQKLSRLLCNNTTLCSIMYFTIHCLALSTFCINCKHNGPRDAVQKNKRDFLGIFPKCWTPPPLSPFWEPLFPKKSVVYFAF